MPLEGHAQRLAQPLRPSRRELRVAIVLAGALAVSLVLVVRASHPTARGPGCVRGTVATATGGALIDACGARARRLCRAVVAPNGDRNAARAIGAQCRRAGYLPALPGPRRSGGT